jgi:DNA-binding NarL/FixJ family response regulator
MNGKDFKKLQLQWYKKLAAKGFKDIEAFQDKDEFLKTWDSQYFKDPKVARNIESASRYYTLARQFLHEHVFDTSLEKRIWAEFSEGLSIVDIADKLKSTRSKVDTRLKKLKKVCYGR